MKLRLLLCLLLALPTSALARDAKAAEVGLDARDSADIGTAALRHLLKQPEGSIDLARAKVTIDHMADPTVDIEGTLRQLDQWAAKVNARFPIGASNKLKMDLLISTLYQPGPWNDHRPFSYDYTDPFGKDLKNTLLSTYLATRKGQCVIMPVAFVLLGQKLGLPVTMTTAPYHLIVKYGDEEQGQWTNLEATSGFFRADTMYERTLHISAEATKHDTYLRPYTQRESIALFATATLAPTHKVKRQPELLLQVTDLILEANPKDVIAMTLRGDAYYALIEQRFMRKYPTAQQIPAAQREEYLSYIRKNEEWYAKAAALGWREWTEPQRADYVKHFMNMKSNSEQGSM